MVALLLLISLITFVIFYVFPAGDPAVLRAGAKAGPADIAAVRKSLGLDRPVTVQYVRYMNRLLLHFDLGRSYVNDAPVRSLVLSRLPATISVAVGGVLVWLLIALPVGIVSALKRRSLLDRLAMGGSLVAISAPVYWLGLVSLYLFASDVGKLHVLPGQGSYVPISQDPVQWLKALALPWLVLGASGAAVYARLLRGNLVNTMSEDYIRTARAKGLRERTVVMRHGVRSAVTPIVTIIGIDIGVLLGGAILTERVFNIPGIGHLSIDAIQSQDIPTIQGTVLLAAFFIIVLNLVVDIAYTLIDPRVGHG